MARERWEDAYIVALAGTGGNSSKAARAAGVHRNTPAYHCRRDESFRERVESVQPKREPSSGQSG